MGSVATQYRTNPLTRTDANANDAARYLGRTFRPCSRLRHFDLEGPVASRQLSKRDSRLRTCQRRSRVDDGRCAFISGHRSVKYVLAAKTDDRWSFHQICPRRPAFRNTVRAKTAICRARVRNESRIWPGVTVASSVGARSQATFDATSSRCSRGVSVCDVRNPYCGQEGQS
jgi:hypothetical protein